MPQLEGKFLRFTEMREKVDQVEELMGNMNAVKTRSGAGLTESKQANLDTLNETLVPI